MKARRAHVLIVDDEPNIRKTLGDVLRDEGYGVSAAADADEAERIIDLGGIDLLLLDVLLPGTDGMTFLKRLQDGGSELPVIMMSGHGTIQTAVQATQLGAIDFIEKPIKVERLLVSMQNGLRIHRLHAENIRLREEIGPLDLIIGASATMARLRDEIARAAPTNARVLITGENGTGKELVARALHAGSKRVDLPFITLNCAAIPSELLESELFGHEKGAFTGAVSARRGKFELAQNGTLLLDEIGDMSAGAQAKLLRVLEDGQLERLGSERSISIDVRVFSSTNRDLTRLMKEGGFREDLYHRLSVIPIHVAPLRDHLQDVDDLATHYLQHFCRMNGRREKQLADGARAALRAHTWPGNVRELKNVMERLVIMVDGIDVTADHLRAVLPDTRSEGDVARDDTTLAEKLEAYERRLIERALDESAGNAAEAARRLGLDRANLHRKMKRLGVNR